MRFTEDDVARFAEWSGDRNPLHVDPVFARRTYFGEPIAHGMLSAIGALASEYAPSGGSLASLDIEFKGAVHPGVSYDVESATTPGGCQVVVRSADAAVLSIRRNSEATDTHAFDVAWLASNAPGTTSGLRLEPAQRRDREFETGLTLTGMYAARQIPGEYVRGDGLGETQARVLALCSYLVGMEIPGLHSLFTRASVHFAPGMEHGSPDLLYRARAARFDRQFRMLELHVDVATLDGRPVAFAVLRVYVRFTPVVVEPAELARRLAPAAGRLAGKVALVCGGTRGLGAHLTAALALAGCHVYASFHRDEAAAEELRHALQPHGVAVEFLQGDAGDREWCEATLARLRARHGRLNLVLLNACAPPALLRLGASTAQRFDSYVTDNLRLVHTPLTTWLPVVQESGGTIAYVSSSFVEEPPAGFGHYVAVKLAGEGFLRTAVREATGVAGLIVRPPRLQTSWNDTPTGVLGTIPADWVASHVVDRLGELTNTGGLEVLSAFPPFDVRDEAEKPDDTPAFTLALSASFTTDLMLPGLRFWFHELGLRGEIQVAPYNQVLQTLLDPGSVFAARGRGANVVYLRVRDWVRELPDTQAASQESLRTHLEAAASDFDRAMRTHRARAGNQTFLIVCPCGSSSLAQDALLKNIERDLATRLAGLPGLTIVDASVAHEQYAVRHYDIHDPLRDKVGHIPYRDAYFHVLSALTMRHVYRGIMPSRKVVVVDADNTLWRGVVGEVGPAGVTFDAGHRALHAALVRRAGSGMLVAVCSKNEENDVWEVFDTRTELALKREHIVGATINWHPKSHNLRALATRLNLGLDSFIFIDDNPVECAEVRANCPEVLTLEWPQDPDAAVRLLHHTWELDAVQATAEDARRTQMYREEHQRQQVQDGALTLADFLRSLDLVVDIAPLTTDDVRRASQLTLRTNQFNFTTRRRDESEMQALLAAGRHDVRVVRVRDRFGDYGLVGLIIAGRDAHALAVDTFLLSCRVLGRGVEHRMAAEVGRLAHDRGDTAVRMQVSFTKKNMPARQFLQAIAPPAFLTSTDSAADAVLPADFLAQLQFEPPLDEVATGEMAAEGGVSDPRVVDAPRRCTREAQIVRAAGDLATIDGLARAIDGAKLGTRGEIKGGQEGIAEAVYTAFAAALGVSTATVEQTDRLEALGCDSLKIVEITVDLIARFPWLPPTLLFEHRSVAEIVNSIGALTRRAGEDSAESAPADVRRRSARSEAAPRDMEIAVVGLHLRCAGANSAEELWDLLSAGRRAITPVPVDRPYFLHRLSDARPHWAGLLDDVDRFDPEFFGISPREAELMDPQGRLFLEVAWGALEDAGCVGVNREADTGVFVGVMYGDYGRTANGLGPGAADSPYKCWEGFSLPNRLSQVLDLHGPSIAVDTACSSSATALHLACGSLLAGDCRVALVGGVNLILDPDRFAQLGRLGILSATGHCQAFGADADGTVLGEGVGVVVLRPLADALRRRDRIYGVIKGTGVSTGNGTVGFTAPNPQAQAIAIRRALVAARLDPRTITYVETHGTGTALGDPIEVRGLTLAYGDTTLHDSRIRGEQRCQIASIKPNIGHLEAGAGVIALIKVLLQLQHRMLLPSLTSPQPNPQIAFGDLPFDIQRTLQPWNPIELEVDGARCAMPRRAGLSAFGVGGANVHVIVEEAPRVDADGSTLEPPTQILTLSARSDDSLRQHARALCEWLTAHPDANLADVAYTLNTSRSHFDRRLAITAKSAADAAALLERIGAGDDPPGTERGVVSRSDARPKVAFLFTGQGSQYAGMGKAFYEAHPVFRQAVDRCAAVLDPLIGRSLVGLLCSAEGSPDADLLNQTGNTQPALFAFEYAMSELWRSWGVEPDVVMGHSVGEIAALCVAGGVSLEGGLELIAARGRLMQALPPGGMMTSIMAPETRVIEVIAEWTDHVAIAAVNAPGQIVISGAGAAVTEITSRLAADGVSTRPLTVSHAFHSPLMRPMVSDFAAAVSRIPFTTPRVPIVSCVTSDIITDEVVQSDYWIRQVLDPVRFTDGMARLEQANVNTFVEVGPHPVLLGMARQCVSGDGRLWLPSLRRDADPWSTLLGALAKLYVRGVEVDWNAFDAPFGRARVSLPPYQFRRKRFWIDSRKQTLREPVQSAVNARVQPASGGPGSSRARLYRVDWQTRALADASVRSSSPTRWLVFADSAGHGGELARVLAHRGEACTLVERGAELEKTSSAYRVNPRSRSDFERMLKDVAGERPVRAVYLWGLDLPTLEASDTVPHLSAALQGAIHLAQALARGPARGSALWLVTRGAVGMDVRSPAQSALWGLGRTIGLESPDVWGGLIDLSSTPDAAEAETLAGALLAPDVEDQIALRGASQLVPRLVRQEDPPAVAQAGFPSDGAYLITGGLGALGLRVARWLASKGVRHIVLTSRRATPGPEADSLLRSLHTQGVAVRIEPADVSNSADVARLIAQFGAGLPPLRGIVHAAGVDRLVPLAELSAADLNAVLSAKVEGARLLDQYTGHLDLAAFICFSSVASVLGSSGRAHYAAANAFLDGLAWDRRRRGLAALTVNWGPWSGGGMATPDTLAQFERLGNHGLLPDDALARLDEALGTGLPQVAVADIDWTVFRPVYEARRPRPILLPLAEDQSAARADTRDTSSDTWIGQLRGTPTEDRLALMTRLLRIEVARTLGADAPGDIPVDRPFSELGMDSLLSAELAGNLHKRLGVNCGALLFAHPQIDRLAPSFLAILPLAGNVSSATAHASAVDGGLAAVQAAAPDKRVEVLPLDAQPKTSDGVVRYAAGMEDEVFAFQREAFPSRRRDWIEPRWRWMFLDSAKRLGVEPRVWLHRHENRLVGHNGGIPVRLKAGSEQVTATWLVDTHVLEEYRRLAVGARLMVAAQDDLPFALSLGQRPHMREIQFRLGWEQVAPLQIARLLIRPERVLKGKLPAPVALAAGLGFRTSAVMRSAFQARRRLDVRDISCFGARHDALWERASRDLSCAVVRDASYLNWKYVRQPGQQFVRLELLHGDTVAAVVILMLLPPDEAYRYTRAFIVDLVAPLSESGTLQDALRAAVEAAANRGADAIMCLHISTSLTCALRQVGFQLREPTRYLLVRGGNLSETARQAILGESAWFITHGDSDIDRPW